MNYAGDLGLMPMRDHVLEKLRYGAQRAMSKAALMDGEANVAINYSIDSAVLSIRAAVWAEQLDAGTKQFPATWWDHLKQRWFPRWALQRWPVEYVDFDWKVYRTYPDYLRVSQSPKIVVHSVVVTPARLLP